MHFPTFGPRKVVYQDPFQQIYTVTADFGSFTKQYFVRDTGQRAGIVVVDRGSVLLVRQYRLQINGLSYEIPGGRVEEGEAPEKAAARECLEEAGIRCLNLKPLLFFHQGLDILHNPTHLFYSDDWVADDEAHVDSREVQGQVWVPLSDAIDMIFKSKIVDSLSIVALMAFKELQARQ